MNFLFWNLNKKKIGKYISDLCEDYNIDILIVAESSYIGSELLIELNKDKVEFFPQNPISQCKKIQIYTRFHYDFIAPIFEENRLTIRELTLPYVDKILITAIHYFDKYNHSDESQSEEASIIIKKIEEVENNYNNTKNLIVGDFNMNPFEKPLIKANGFNATMSSKIASQEIKTVQGNQFKYFYNPMWSLFGDLYSCPEGTYYYKHAEYINYQWNIFDQVLLRPELINYFNKKSLKIISKIGKKNILLDQNHIPNKNDFSDHLPITFSLNLINNKN